MHDTAKGEQHAESPLLLKEPIQLPERDHQCDCTGRCHCSEYNVKLARQENVSSAIPPYMRTGNDGPYATPSTRSALSVRGPPPPPNVGEDTRGIGEHLGVSEPPRGLFSNYRDSYASHISTGESVDLDRDTEATGNDTAGHHL